jgi:DNA-binding MarR family transcriptional regulator
MVKQRIFTKEENEVLTEVYRRLKYLNNKVSDKLLTLSRPHKTKSLIKDGFLEPSSKEVPRVLNFYRLTEKGKELFKNINFADNFNQKENEELFNGEKVITFKYESKE